MKFEKLGPVGPEVFCSAGSKSGAAHSKEGNCDKQEAVTKFTLTEVGLGFNQLFSVLRRPFPFVGNHARARRRNSGISRRPPRFGSLVQYLPFLHPGLKAGF
jgi:hypothetical protein